MPEAGQAVKGGWGRRKTTIFGDNCDGSPRRGDLANARKKHGKLTFAKKNDIFSLFILLKKECIMIHSLKVKNFCSFREEQVFSLEGGKTTENDYRFIATPSGKNVACVAMIFGANASGKTNLLKVFPFLAWFIKFSWMALKPTQKISFTPFLFTDSTNDPTEFELVSETMDGDIYIYSLSLTRDEVLHESLRIRSLGKVKSALIFLREHENYKVYPRAGFALKEIPQKTFRKNTSFIAAIRQTDIDVFDDFVETLDFNMNVDFFGRTEDVNDLYLDVLASKKNISSMIDSFIKKCDTGISKIIVEKKDISEEEKERIRKIRIKIFEQKNSIDEEEIKFYEANAIHSVRGAQYNLALELESNGTQKAISFLTEAFSVLERGGTIIYDEIEHGLHPLLVQYFVDLFYDDTINIKKSQLICTCHATDCMNFLHKRQIFLAEKDSNQESSIFRLSDIAGIRNDDNIMQKYLSGTYGGVPIL